MQHRYTGTYGTRLRTRMSYFNDFFCNIVQWFIHIGSLHYEICSYLLLFAILKKKCSACMVHALFHFLTGQAIFEWTGGAVFDLWWTGLEGEPLLHRLRRPRFCSFVMLQVQFYFITLFANATCRNTRSIYVHVCRKHQLQKRPWTSVLAPNFTWCSVPSVIRIDCMNSINMTSIRLWSALS